MTIDSSPFVSVPYAIRAKYAENLKTGTSSKTGKESKDERIEALEEEVKELKDLVNQLIKK